MSTNNNYTDGLRVKIAEKYKPPRKINLPLTYAQRLNLNKNLLENLPTYDFGLEQSVAGKMREWRAFRNTLQQERRQRLERLKVLVDDLEDTKSPPQDILVPTQVLKPTAASFPAPTDKSPFNIAEFEDDTSSPFDNMELKSINDMEELARVLQDKNYNPAPSTANTTNNTSNYAQSTAQYAPNGFYSTNYCYFDNSKMAVTESAATNADPLRNVPNVVRQLQEELKSIKVADEMADCMADFDALPKNQQDMCRSISLMGFPLGRVVRTCQLLDGDHKKIVDHLLVLSELLDLGFQEKDISEALLQSGNDKEKALDILIS